MLLKSAVMDMKTNLHVGYTVIRKLTLKLEIGRSCWAFFMLL